MAGFAELLQRLARELEQAEGQRPEDDLRARLGYGPADDADDVDDDPAPGDGAWDPEAPRTPATLRRVAEERRTSPLATPATLPRRDAPLEPALARSIGARMHAPDGLREAFVIKELLDRPLGIRRRR